MDIKHKEVFLVAFVGFFPADFFRFFTQIRLHFKRKDGKKYIKGL